MCIRDRITSAFHDITVGSNECLAGTNYCSGLPLTDYAAGTGYDEASGLGSVDFFNLLTAWPANTVATGSKFTISATNVTTTNGTTATSTFTVTPAGGYTGAVAFRIYSTVPVPYACFSAPNANITGATAVTASATLTTDVSACPSGTTPLTVGSGTTVASAQPPQHAPAPVSYTHLDVYKRQSWGLVNRVVPAAELLDTALGLAQTIAANGPLAVRMTKELVRRAVLDDPTRGWATPEELSAIFASEDAQEGAVAFLEKRPANWKGR